MHTVGVVFQEIHKQTCAAHAFLFTNFNGNIFSAFFLLLFFLICIYFCATYEWSYTSIVLYKKNLNKVNICVDCLFRSRHLFHFENAFTWIDTPDTHAVMPQSVVVSYKTNLQQQCYNFFNLAPDFRYGRGASSCQHTDQHPQFPSQPPADTEPHHASVWSHGHSTE